MLVEAVGSAAGVIALAYKFDIRKVLGYDAIVDIAATVSLAILFQGTYSGMVVAMVAGLLVSLILSVLKRRVGYKKLRFVDRKPTWVEYGPVY
jgi:prepilin signal peptidase PulO-like enzyme (type II secretory pathway)